MDFVEFIQSLLNAFVESIRRNKIAAWLSLTAFILSSALVFGIGEYDERPRFRWTTLPAITKVEEQFFRVMHEVERETDDVRRVHYFLEGHRLAKVVLRTIRTERPVTTAGRKAHRELVRYYELVDEQLAIIRTEMSFRESFDYVREWKERNADLMIIREEWLRWIEARS
jgi:hypothetical protein